MAAATIITDNWPEPVGDSALVGLAGDIISGIMPHSEADKSGLLLQLLAAVGNAIGPNPYYQVESTRHHVNLFVVIVGDTSRARKGTSWQWIKKIVTEADTGWNQCVASGLSSGEGMIYHVRDDNEGQPPDRRLLAVEGEFAQTLKVARREGNTLSPVLRNAWDGGVLRTLTRNNPLISTDPHISVIGHITTEELHHNLSEVEMANGLGNRFLWGVVRRSKSLPFGGCMDQGFFNNITARLSEVLKFARSCDEVSMDEDARAVYTGLYERIMNSSSAGLIGAMTARIEAHLVRLAALYALLDKSCVITKGHLLSAHTVINYCERSVAHIFSSVTGNRIADAILQELDTQGRVSRNMIYNLGAKHWRRREVDDAIDLLMNEYGVIKVEEATKGRPRTVFVHGAGKSSCMNDIAGLA